MIVLFIALQVIAAVAARSLFSVRHWRWSRRETLLSTVVPLVLFVVWACSWYVVPLDILPERWFDRAPTIGTLAFMCIPPFVASWLLFVWLSTRAGHGNVKA